MLTVALVSLLSILPPSPKHWVTDDAQLIHQGAQRRLDRRLEAIEHATGYEILIWTGKNTGGEPLDKFAERTFNLWRNSHPRLDHGAILFVTPEQSRLQVGAGLQHIFTPEVSKQILDQNLGAMLAAGEPEVAFSSAVDAFAARVTGAPFPATPVKDHLSAQQWWTILIAGVAFLLMFFIARPESYRWFFSRLLFLRRRDRTLSSQP
jgi:uncharacterized membrane protein YgcG